MIQLIGDIAPTGLYVDDAKNNPKRIAQILDFFDNEDLKFANLETPIFVEKSQNKYKNFIHTTNQQALNDVLKPLKIDAVSLANNHIYDCTLKGVKATIEALDELNIKFTGAGYKPEHIEPIYFEKENKTIAFLAYVDSSTNPKTENFDDLYINYFSIEKVKEDLLKLQKKADIIICSIHWGIDYSFYPTPSQRQKAKQLIDAGITIVMGHHPHTIQPYEKYKDGLIFYSLGSFTFGDFINQKNSLDALFIKTKKSFIAKLNSNIEFSYISIAELKENILIKTNFNYEKWSKNKWFKYKILNSNKFLKRIFKSYEKKELYITNAICGYYRKDIKYYLSKYFKK